MEDVPWAYRWPGSPRITFLVPWHPVLPALPPLLMWGPATQLCLRLLVGQHSYPLSTWQQRRLSLGFLVLPDPQKEDILLFTETSSHCWLLRTLWFLVNYRSQTGLFNDFYLPVDEPGSRMLQCLFVMLNLSNRGSLPTPSVHKRQLWRAWVLSGCTVAPGYGDHCMGPKHWDSSILALPLIDCVVIHSPIFCSFCKMGIHNSLHSEHGIIYVDVNI